MENNKLMVFHWSDQNSRRQCKASTVIAPAESGWLPPHPTSSEPFIGGKSFSLQISRFPSAIISGGGLRANHELGPGAETIVLQLIWGS